MPRLEMNIQCIFIIVTRSGGQFEALIDENPDKKHILKLDNLPEEVPTKAI